jgi:hypothetical protein
MRIRPPPPAPSLDALAAIAPDLGLTLEQADEIADLARRITIRRAREAGLVLAPSDAAAYTELPATRRAAMRAGVVRVMEALVLLGWIDGA